MESIKNEATEGQERAVVKAVYIKPTIVSFDADSTCKVIATSEEITDDGSGSTYGPS